MYTESHHNSHRLIDLKERVKELGGGSCLENVPDEFLGITKLENLILSLEEQAENKLHVESLPSHYFLELTNICNLRCPLCPTGSRQSSRPKGKMNTTLFKGIVDQCSDVMLKVFVQNWGESTLHGDIVELIRYCSSKGIFVRLSTNLSLKYDGAFLERLMCSGLAQIHCDVDGITQEVYEKYRQKGKLDQVLVNLKRLVSLKNERQLKVPEIEAALIVSRINEHQVEDFKFMMREMGVDRITVDRLQVNPNTGLDWLPDNKGLRYNNYLRENDAAKRCARLWDSLCVCWDGSVSACCVVDDPVADFANIRGKTVSEVWNNSVFQSARSVFGPSPQEKPHTICHICCNKLWSKNLSRVGDSFGIRLS